jgi:Rps23 Pro-64 3,4-dihydroxylase Tpa1-like proline 4-hydroxylase
VPAYNSLVLFKVPVWHSVTFVTPFAGEVRYSITGWLKV